MSFFLVAGFMLMSPELEHKLNLPGETLNMQMEREMKELKRQRDLAQSQLEVERTQHKERKVLC